MGCLRACRGNTRRFNNSDRSLSADFKLVPVNSCGDFGVSSDAIRGDGESMTGGSDSGGGAAGGGIALGGGGGGGGITSVTSVEFSLRTLT